MIGYFRDIDDIGNNYAMADSITKSTGHAVSQYHQLIPVSQLKLKEIIGEGMHL